MDRYKKLMCVKGLLMSLDEQIYKIDQEKGKTVINPKKMQEVYNDVIDQYWDAIKEQLEEEDKKTIEPCSIIKVNGVSHSYQAKTIRFDEIARFANLKCRNEDLTITYSGGMIETSGHSGTILPNTEIEVANNMIFNAVMTNKA